MKVISTTNYELERKLKNLLVLYKSDKILPATVAYSVIRAVTTMQDTLSPYVMVRDQLVKRYSNGGTSLSLEENPDAYTACIKELDEIGNKHVQIEIPEIKVEDFKDAKFTLSEMDALNILISQ